MWCEVFKKDIITTDKLEHGEILCFAQGIVQSSVYFNGTGSTRNNYSGSNLQSVINKWYDDNLKSSMDSYIVSKTLTTIHKDGTSSLNAKLFPLAGNSTSESFYYGDYMSAGYGGSMDLDTAWWLRSGYLSGSYGVYYVTADGNVRATDSANPHGVRPAFVLKI